MSGIRSRYVDAETIRRLMVERKITRKAAADRMFVSPATLATALRKGRMSDLVLDGIAGILGLDPEALLVPEGACPPTPPRVICKTPIDRRKVQRRLKACGVTQKEIAEIIGISAYTICITLKRGTTSDKVLDRLASELNVCREELQPDIVPKG